LPTWQAFYKEKHTMSIKRIVTPQVRKAQSDLIEALRGSVKSAVQESGLTRVEAEGNLSAVMADVWLEVERRIIAGSLRAGDLFAAGCGKALLSGSLQARSVRQLVIPCPLSMSG
jgi:hypothetical protein